MLCGAQAFLRGETDSHKISTDIGTSLKNVQNVKSVVKRLLNEKVQEYSLDSQGKNPVGNVIPVQ